MWTAEQIEERLAELRADPPKRARFVMLREAERAELVGFKSLIDKHLSHFSASSDCPCCGDGYFVWGLHHGHGHCDVCGWPATAIHRVYENPDDDEPVAKFDAILWAHPSEVTTKAEREAKRSQ